MGPRAKLGFRVTSALVNITSRLPRDICLGEYHLHSLHKVWTSLDAVLGTGRLESTQSIPGWVPDHTTLYGLGTLPSIARSVGQGSPWVNPEHSWVSTRPIQLYMGWVPRLVNPRLDFSRSRVSFI
jgi:hypothetical protein